MARILQDYDPINSQIADMTNELNEMQRRLNTLESEAQKTKREIINNKEQLSNSIEQIMKDKSKISQISEKQRLAELALKKNITVIEDTLEEFK